jgi:putative hydrolase of the HAD superfamily
VQHITTLFFDIGGVCLSNGWNLEQRKRVAQQFNFDDAAFEGRHVQVVDMFDRGQMSLHDYLQWTLFYEPRSFSAAAISESMTQQSTPIKETLELLRAIKKTGNYMLMTINNESRELNEYRVQHYKLHDIFSAFFSSCYLGLLKPQHEIYRRALAISQRQASNCVFVDDWSHSAEVAGSLGMQPVVFTNAAQLEKDLLELGVTF